MPTLVISLDFELFWGVIASRTIENYGANIENEWLAIPAMLKLFKKYNVNVTWATVGMLMCKDFKKWSDLRPSIMPTYKNERYSTYSVSMLARDFPKLFFAPSLVEQILAIDGQELASHTYSHLYCNEEGVSIEQFISDLDCAQRIFDDYKVKPTSLVFPRNQIRNEFLFALSEASFTAYRGNQDNWIYGGGHLGQTSYGIVKRLIRAADSFFPITDNHIYCLLASPKGCL